MCQRSVRFPRLYLGLASAAAARQPATRRHIAAAIRVLLSPSLCDGAQISSVLLFLEFCGHFTLSWRPLPSVFKTHETETPC